MTTLEQRAERRYRSRAVRSPRIRLPSRGSATSTGEFFELEKQKLWPKVPGRWPAGWRRSPTPGDFVEYEICDQSILIVRQDDMSVKALSQRLPTPRHGARPRDPAGHPRTADRLPVPRVALEPRRLHLVRLRARGLRARLRAPRRPAPSGVSARHLGRLRVDQHGSRAPPAGRGAVPGAPSCSTPSASATCGCSGGRRSSSAPTGRSRRRPSTRAGTSWRTHPQLTMGMGEDYPVGQCRVHGASRTATRASRAASTPPRAGSPRAGGPTSSSGDRRPSGRARTP